MEKRLHLIIRGRVQGIFYRDNTAQQAQKLGLTGFVRNLPDGAVEVVAEGEEEQLKKLAALCRRGPALAKVEKTEECWEEGKQEFSDFGVRY